jgi:hypothetical protein
MKRCHQCGAVWDGKGKKQPGPKDICDKCSAYLHCCLNCRYYDPSAHNQCYIPTTEWVGDKAGGNFCDEFEFADRTAEKGNADAGHEARNALDSLFGGDKDASTDADKLDDFKKLFGE